MAAACRHPRQQKRGGRSLQAPHTARKGEAAAYRHPMQQKKERPHLTQQQMEQHP